MATSLNSQRQGCGKFIEHLTPTFPVASARARGVEGGSPGEQADQGWRLPYPGQAHRPANEQDMALPGLVQSWTLPSWAAPGACTLR